MFTFPTAYWVARKYEQDDPIIFFPLAAAVLTDLIILMPWVFKVISVYVGWVLSF